MKPKILIIDDDSLFLRYVRSILDTQYRIYTSSTIENVNLFMVDMEFEVIIINEETTSHKTLIAFIEKLKRIPRYSNTPVIVMYTSEIEDDFRFPTDPKIDRYIQKKYNQEYLLGYIKSFVKK